MPFRVPTGEDYVPLPPKGQYAELIHLRKDEIMKKLLLTSALVAMASMTTANATYLTTDENGNLAAATTTEVPETFSTAAGFTLDYVEETGLYHPDGRTDRNGATYELLSNSDAYTGSDETVTVITGTTDLETNTEAEARAKAEAAKIAEAKAAADAARLEADQARYDNKAQNTLIANNTADLKAAEKALQDRINQEVKDRDAAIAAGDKALADEFQKKINTAVKEREKLRKAISDNSSACLLYTSPSPRDS